MIRLIVSALDGTLCDEGQGLDKQSVDYIKKLQNKGITFMIITDKEYDSILPFFQIYDLHCPLIACNGAVLYDEEGITREEDWIHRERVIEIMKLIRKEEVVIWYTSKGTYYTQASRDDILPHRKKMEEETMKEVLRLSKVYKIAILHCSPTAYVALRTMSDITIVSHAAHTTELIAKDVSTYHAVCAYCEQHRIGAEEVLAFGKDEVDMQLLRGFPYGHIMRNARAALLEQVNYIAPECGKHGVMKVIENFTNIHIEGDET